MNNRFMQEAINLALESVQRGNGGPFGAVIVRGDTIVGRGANQVTASNDPTAHAEIIAIRDACRWLNTFRLADCELYASCEPCPMCLAAIYWARIKRICYASTRNDAVEAGFSDELIHREIKLPPGERILRTEQVKHSDALLPFAAWSKKTDKIRY
jgi:tRNA(Arg) A34 adenosine deaminase TadA